MKGQAREEVSPKGWRSALTFVPKHPISTPGSWLMNIIWLMSPELYNLFYKKKTKTRSSSPSHF